MISSTRRMEFISSVIVPQFKLHAAAGGQAEITCRSISRVDQCERITRFGSSGHFQWTNTFVGESIELRFAGAKSSNTCIDFSRKQMLTLGGNNNNKFNWHTFIFLFYGGRSPHSSWALKRAVSISIFYSFSLFALIPSLHQIQWNFHIIIMAIECVCVCVSRINSIAQDWMDSNVRRSFKNYCHDSVFEIDYSKNCHRVIVVEHVSSKKCTKLNSMHSAARSTYIHVNDDNNIYATATTALCHGQPSHELCTLFFV